MRHARAVVVVVGLSCFCLASEVAAYDCQDGGEGVVTFAQMNWLGSWDEFGRSVVYLEAKTTRSVEDGDNCPGNVRVEAWIDGGDGAKVRQSKYIAHIGDPYDAATEVSKLVYRTPIDQPIDGHSKHWFIYDGWFSDPWTDLGQLARRVTLPGSEPDPDDDPPPDPCDSPETCEIDPGDQESPLIVDLDHDG